MRPSLSWTFAALAVVTVTPQYASAQYAAIAVQAGSPNADTNGVQMLGKLHYRLERDFDVGDGLLVLAARGLLTFGERIEPQLHTNLVQEANIVIETECIALRLGRQLVLWGVADGFNPTDVATPTNYQLASYGTRDLRFGVDGLLAEFALSDSTTLSALAITHNKTSLMSRGLDPTATHDPDQPYRARDQGYGVRLSWLSPIGDFNLSGYQGPGSLALVIPSAAGTSLASPEIKMYGLDFDTVVGPWRIYAELGLHRYSGGEKHVADAFLPDDEFQTVAGVERELSGANRLGFQVLHRELQTDRASATEVAAPFSDGARESYGQYATNQTGASLISFWESPSTEWSGDVTLASWFQDDSYLRVRGKYRINENQSIYLFGSWFFGPSNSAFGDLSDTSSTSLEYRWSF